MAGVADTADLSRSQLNAGEEYFDFCCTKCFKKKKRTKPASKYCVNCKRYFCDSCVEDHDSFDAMREHSMIDPDSTNTTGTRTCLVPMLTELCTLHPQKLVDMYCEDDDYVGCSVCFNENHKHCPDTYHIPDYVQSHSPTSQVHKISTDLTEAITAMTSLHTQQDRSDDVLDKSKAICKLEIQKYRNEMNQIFDKVEENTLDKLDATCTEIKTKKADTVEHIQDLRDAMIRLKSEIESEHCNDCQKFVIDKLGQCLIKKCRKLESKKSCYETSKLTFIRNSEITSFFSTVSVLGTTRHPLPIRFSSQSRPARPAKGPSVSGSDIDGKNVPDSEATKKPENQEVYQIIDRSEYYIKETDDRCKCEIWSSCSLDNKHVLLADSSNYKIKIFDCRTFNIKSSLTLDARVLSVCKVNENEAAVCLYNKTIHFVSTHGKLEVKRSFIMNHNGRSITVVKDKMYVGYDRYIYVYKLNGKIVRTISIDKQGLNLFSNIWDIAASDDGKMIHVADYHKGVITLSTDGKVLWRYAGAELRGANGVSTDGAGHVITSGHESCNVIQLGQDGQFTGDIVTISGLEKPRTVCFDRYNRRLIVGITDDLVVFTVKGEVDKLEP